MAKRMQEEKGEERIVAKSKPTLNLVTHAATSSLAVQSPIASKKSGDTQGTLSTLIGKVQGDVKRENTIKTQRRVLKCGKEMQCWTRVRGDS